MKVAASTIWEMLEDAGIDPAPERSATTWAAFPRSQADALLAREFFEMVTLSGTRRYAFAVIEYTSRRIRILGATTHPTAPWVTRAARNLRDGPARRRHPRPLPYPGPGQGQEAPRPVRVILADSGIEVVFSGVWMPRMNSVMERWGYIRHELLDYTLIWNQAHLLHAQREFGYFCNEHCPYQWLRHLELASPSARYWSESARWSG